MRTHFILREDNIIIIMYRHDFITTISRDSVNQATIYNHRLRNRGEIIGIQNYHFAKSTMHHRLVLMAIIQGALKGRHVSLYRRTKTHIILMI